MTFIDVSLLTNTSELCAHILRGSVHGKQMCWRDVWKGQSTNTRCFEQNSIEKKHLFIIICSCQTSRWKYWSHFIYLENSFWKTRMFISKNARYEDKYRNEIYYKKKQPNSSWFEKFESMKECMFDESTEDRNFYPFCRLSDLFHLFRLVWSWID